MSEGAEPTLFSRLFSQDLSDKKEDKGKFTYLSWTDAWEVINRLCDDVSYEIHDDISYPDGSLEVRCSVSIEGKTHMMWLPVKDHMQKAISNPSARQVSDARMRCLVKALAMFGLGLYIYQGEDIPAGEARDYQSMKKELEESPHSWAIAYMQMDEDTKAEINQSALAFKKKTEWSKQILDAVTAVHKWADQWAESLSEMLLPEDGEPKLDSIAETMKEFEPYERWLVMQRFEESDKEQFRNIYTESLKNG